MGRGRPRDGWTIGVETCVVIDGVNMPLAIGRHLYSQLLLLLLLVSARSREGRIRLDAEKLAQNVEEDSHGFSLHFPADN